MAEHAQEVTGQIAFQCQPLARLVLVGDGPERKAMRSRIPGAIFAGTRRGEDLAAHYASGDIFLFPSLTETYGNVTPEALAMMDEFDQLYGVSRALAAAPPPVAVPIPAPIVVLPPVVAHPHPSGPAIAVPAKPNSTETQHPPARPELPGKSPAAPGLAPDGFRAGYATYLQSASIGEVAGLAGLGVSGLAALTAVGGLIGFRQAKAGLAVKAVGTARFLQ